MAAEGSCAETMKKPYSKRFCGLPSFPTATIVLLLIQATCSGYSAASRSSRSPLYDDFYRPPPKFDDLNIRNVNAKVGQTVLLPCTVRYLGDKVVSWIRRKDLLIISSGIYTFSGDNRFEPVYSVDRNFWGLRIRGVKETDMGQYECQVNTDPKMSLAINLTVIDPTSQSFKVERRIRIKGPSQLHVHSGSAVVFTCELASVPKFPDQAKQTVPKSGTSVKWFRNGFEITFDSARGGISIENNYGETSIISKLKLVSVTDEDGGQYVCSDGSSVPATVHLFVVESEHSEAMQRDYPHSSSNLLEKNLGLLPILCCLLLR